ncbi:MAG: hypothetical protein JW744_05690 [Candidatus Diapherotrites archaeon]|uniref:Uncharacterized protein n=1 Tax=Candidatus Iainarchaeum sp. TaxID=3101447 RepID=A0A938YYZ8_9ARCH|nr:hypothetical protein [Candidatus Diapherotrites archaeon]
MKGIDSRILAFALALLIVAIALVLFFRSLNPNTVVVEGTLISSAGESPFSAFSGLTENYSFVVSPQIYDPVVNIDQYMFNGAALFLVVLEGNSRNSTLLIRAYSPENELIYCSTNYGDLTREARIGIEECNSILNRAGEAIVLVQFPDGSQAQPGIELEGNIITIKPKSYSDVGSTCLLALRLMFQNSGEIIAASNDIIGRISRQQ